MLQKFAVAASLVLFSLGASAEGKAGSGPNPYVDCGIGAALFPNTNWAAVSSNVIWDIGTTAVISATASPETCEGKDVVAALFIRDTYNELVESAATGSNAHVTALFDIFSCDSTQLPTAIESFRAGVADVVSEPTYSEQASLEKAAQVFQVAHASSSSCAS